MGRIKTQERILFLEKDDTCNVDIASHSNIAQHQPTYAVWTPRSCTEVVLLCRDCKFVQNCSVTKVSKWIRDGTNEMAHALPPSVKFQSCCTKSEVHAILDGIWISEYQNTVSCMKHAVRTVQNSNWKLYSFDERATWQSRKDVADADAAKKDNAKGKTSPAVEFVDVTDALILHELIRRHAIVCKTRSTYGRFVPVLRR